MIFVEEVKCCIVPTLDILTIFASTTLLLLETFVCNFCAANNHISALKTDSMLGFEPNPQSPNFF